MADAIEPVLLQGYDVTGAVAGQQTIPTQGYAGESGPISVEGRLVVNQTGATVVS